MQLECWERERNVHANWIENESNWDERELVLIEQTQSNLLRLVSQTDFPFLLSCIKQICVSSADHRPPLDTQAHTRDRHRVGWK